MIPIYFLTIQGSPIRLSTKLVLRSTDLALQRLERNNSGLYRCTADNLQGKGKSNEIRIDIKRKPITPHCSIVHY